MITVKRQWHLFVALFIFIFTYGCASTGRQITKEDLKGFSSVVIAVDSSVTFGKSLSPDEVPLGLNMEIAGRLGEAAADILAQKGFQVSPSRLKTVGAVLNDNEARSPLSAKKQYTIIAGDGTAITTGSPGAPEAPYAIEPQDADAPAVLAMHKELAGLPDEVVYHRSASALLMPNEQTDATRVTSKVSPDCYLVVEAGGRFISKGDEALNVAKGALYSVAIIGMAVGGGSGSLGGMEFAKDTIQLKVYLVDSEGRIVWKDTMTKSDNPENDNFKKFLTSALSKLPLR
ncbi:MAG: hypothetical protein HZB85_08325 [Deltaproteobacteria bacterium]|nr:hypothetical protein [Deltaproteobacteria bacterium]